MTKRAHRRRAIQSARDARKRTGRAASELWCGRFLRREKTALALGKMLDERKRLEIDEALR